MNTKLLADMEDREQQVDVAQRASCVAVVPIALDLVMQGRVAPSVETMSAKMKRVRFLDEVTAPGNCLCGSDQVAITDASDDLADIVMFENTPEDQEQHDLDLDQKEQEQEQEHEPNDELKVDATLTHINTMELVSMHERKHDNEKDLALELENENENENECESDCESDQQYEHDAAGSEKEVAYELDDMNKMSAQAPFVCELVLASMEEALDTTPDDALFELYAVHGLTRQEIVPSDNAAVMAEKLEDVLDEEDEWNATLAAQQQYEYQEQEHETEQHEEELYREYSEKQIQKHEQRQLQVMASFDVLAASTMMMMTEARLETSENEDTEAAGSDESQHHSWSQRETIKASADLSAISSLEESCVRYSVRVDSAAQSAIDTPIDDRDDNDDDAVSSIMNRDLCSDAMVDSVSAQPSNECRVEPESALRVGNCTSTSYPTATSLTDVHENIHGQTPHLMSATTEGGSEAPQLITVVSKTTTSAYDATFLLRARAHDDARQRRRHRHGLGPIPRLPVAGVVQQQR
ncbi:hypothetical protein PINS_up012941 [Pythium insidiosum]|nr:hypothetical protein PINS_up012941 [Pythium insidiosum]